MSTTPPGQGHKVVAFFGREASYGAGMGGTPIFKLPVVELDPGPKKLMIESPNLYGEPGLQDAFLGASWAMGTMKLAPNFEGMLEVFRAVHGIGSYGSLVTGSARDHTVKWGDQLQNNCMEFVDGDVPTGKVSRLPGQKLLGYTITGTNSGTDPLLMEIPFFAKDLLPNQNQTVITVPNCSYTNANGNLTRAAGDWNNDVRPGTILTGGVLAGLTTVLSITSPTVCVMSATPGLTQSGITITLTPAFSPLLPVTYRMLASGTTDDGTADAAGSVRVRAFEVSYQNPHTAPEERLYGATNPDEPLRNGPIKATFKITQEYLTTSAMDAYRLHTVGSPQLILRGDTDLGGSKFHELEMRANRAFISDLSRPIQGVKSIMQTVTWTAVRDATDAAPFVARIRNAESALPA